MSTIEFSEQHFHQDTPPRAAAPVRPAKVDRPFLAPPSSGDGAADIAARIIGTVGITPEGARAIVARVIVALGVSEEEFFQYTRSPTIVHARKRLYEELAAGGWSRTQIGRFVRRDASTIQSLLGPIGGGPGVRRARRGAQPAAAE